MQPCDTAMRRVLSGSTFPVQPGEHSSSCSCQVQRPPMPDLAQGVCNAEVHLMERMVQLLQSLDTAGMMQATARGSLILCWVPPYDEVQQVWDTMPVRCYPLPSLD
jgi:hypothetical protein